MKEKLNHTEKPINKLLGLKKENDGQKLSVNIGDKITVTLLEHSTAGYQWSITQLDTNVIAKLKDEYILPKSKNLGMSSERKFTLKALNSATTDVILEEKRSWETKKKPISTFKVTFLIQPRGVNINYDQERLDTLQNYKDQLGQNIDSSTLMAINTEIDKLRNKTSLEKPKENSSIPNLTPTKIK